MHACHAMHARTHRARSKSVSPSPISSISSSTSSSCSAAAAAAAAAAAGAASSGGGGGAIPAAAAAAGCGGDAGCCCCCCCCCCSCALSPAASPRPSSSSCCRDDGDGTGSCFPCRSSSSSHAAPPEAAAAGAAAAAAPAAAAAAAAAGVGAAYVCVKKRWSAEGACVHAAWRSHTYICMHRPRRLTSEEVEDGLLLGPPILLATALRAHSSSSLAMTCLSVRLAVGWLAGQLGSIERMDWSKQHTQHFLLLLLQRARRRVGASCRTCLLLDAWVMSTHIFACTIDEKN